jgi:hypothetical protein
MIARSWDRAVAVVVAVVAVVEAYKTDHWRHYVVDDERKNS